MENLIPIQMIASFNIKGKIIPVRFRYENPEHIRITVDITSATCVQEDNTHAVFRCTAELAPCMEQSFYICYYILPHSWRLVKNYASYRGAGSGSALSKIPSEL